MKSRVPMKRFGVRVVTLVIHRLNLGWAHGALLTTSPGDMTMVKLSQVKAYAMGGSARIQR